MHTYKILYRNQAHAYVDAPNSEVALDRGDLVAADVKGDTALTAIKVLDIYSENPTGTWFRELHFSKGSGTRH